MVFLIGKINPLTSLQRFLISDKVAESFDLTPEEENCGLLDISCSQLETVQDGKVIKDLVCDLFWKARLLEQLYPHIILVRSGESRSVLHHRFQLKCQENGCRQIRGARNRQFGGFTAVETQYQNQITVQCF